GRAMTATSNPRNDTCAVVSFTRSPQNHDVRRVIPGHPTVPGGLACTCVRGSGVCCQISAGDGGSPRSGVAGPPHRGPPTTSVGWVPTSYTRSPTTIIPGMLTERSTDTMPGGTSTGVPGPITSFAITVGPGMGRICDTSSGGTGAVRKTHTNDPIWRTQVNSD